MTFQEIRNRANQVRSIPLQEVLLETGAQRDLCDRAKWRTVQGIISCTGMKFMNWNRNVGGGGAIDLAMHLNGMDFKTAVEWLWNRFPISHHQEQTQPFGATKLILPPQNRCNIPIVRRYLIEQRFIKASLVNALMESGRLYADNRGNAVFLLLGKDNKPVGAELRGTTSVRWRGMAPGSNKDLGFFSVPNPKATSIVLCESAIDATSCFALHPECLCISTAGARPNPQWLPSLIQQGHAIYCGFDSDLVGDNMANAMMLPYPSILRLRPAHHDWNDILKSHSSSELF
jgi:hypothetical protein